jgi:TRAP transporter TAXI family solute receptor
MPSLTRRCVPLLLLVMVCWNAKSASSQTSKVVLAGGQEGGNYARLARAIADECQAHNLPLDVLPTGGSVENLQLLQSRKADFAIVQSDMVGRALRGRRPFRTTFPELVLATPLFIEAVQVLVRSDLFIFTTSELRGKTVSLGPEGSGTEVTARSVLEASGVSIDAKHVPLDQVYDALKREDIDAAVLSSALPTPSVEDVLKGGEARFVLFDGKVTARLASSGSYFTTVIPARTYVGQPEEISTVGVHAFLVTREDVDGGKVAAFLRILFGNREQIERRAGLKLDLLGARPPSNVAIPTHRASEHYLAIPADPRLFWIALLTAIAVAITWGIAKRHQISRSLSAHGEVLLALTALACVWAISSFGLYYYEHNLNETFSSYPKSLWSMLVYISGGFQSRSPLTSNGEVVSVLAIIVGVGVACWFTAELAGRFVRSKIEIIERLLRKNMLPHDLKDHIAVINWDHRVHGMIRQLQKSETSVKRRIVLVSSETKAAAETVDHDHFYTFESDPTDSEVLKRARVQFAHSVTIVSSWCSSDPSDRRKFFDPDTCDAKTIMCLLAIRALCTEFKVRQVPITAEIRSSKNLQAASAAGSMNTEIVCADVFGVNLLAQCAVTPGLAAIYEDLLTFSPGTDEIYKIKLPTHLAGKSFSEVMHFFAERRRDKGRSVIPIGIFRGDRVYLNPPSSSHGGVDPLTGDDQLFVISDSEESYKA